MTGSLLADRCWNLIVSNTELTTRGKFLFMSGETLARLQQQRQQASRPDFIYGVRIMIDDSLPPNRIEMRPFQSRPDLP